MLRSSFNEAWTCVGDSSSMMEEASNMMKAGDKETGFIILPHDAMILEKRDVDNPSGNSGGFYPGGNYIYKKVFEVPKEYEGKNISLEFEGVYHKARVYVNEAYAGSCMNGYRKFIIDITPYLVYGAENEIAVNVCNSDQPNSRWYTGSGIYRPVNLLVGDEIRIAADGLRITTPDVAEDVSLAEVELSYENDNCKTKSTYFVTTILDAEGEIAAQEFTPVTVYPKKNQKIYQRIYIRNAKLWSLESPHLYTCNVKILDAEDCVNSKVCIEKNLVLDESESTFGIRRIQVDPIHGLRLNGEKVLLRGSCVHHDNGVIGAATYADAEARRVELLKKAGFNAIRMAHNSASVQMLDACDRFGMLLMEESFDMWNASKNPYDIALQFETEWEKDLEAIVAKDYNHPCVFMYSIGNEIKEIGTPAAAATTRMLSNKLRELDGTRLITNAVNGLMTLTSKPETLIQVLLEMNLITPEQVQQMLAGDSQTGDINDLMTALLGKVNQMSAHQLVGEKMEESLSGIDLCGYNYMNGRYTPDTEAYPNRIMYGSETLPPDIDTNWKYVKENPRILGDFTWTGWDYIGEAGVGVVDYNSTTGFFKPYPCYLAYCGDFDILGNRRPMSYYREIVWGLRKEPYIAAEYPSHYNDQPMCTPWSAPDSLSSWTWPGFEGKGIRVQVYSDSEEVELLLNSKSLGKMRAGEANRFMAVFDITYQPGRLEAVSYTDGKETGRHVLNTAGEGRNLAVTCNRENMKANGEDLLYVDIALVDDEGNLNTSIDASVTVTVEGSGSLQGLGNADPMSTENFFGQEHATFNGKALAVIRAKKETDSVKITVCAEGYETRIINLTVE